MAEFDDLRQRLRQARAETREAGDGAFAARQRLARVEARQAALERVFDPTKAAHAKERERLEGERAAAAALVERSRSIKEQAGRFAQEALAGFADWTDPREGIKLLQDRIPILLLPVRLETRFKAGILDPTGRPRTQLWVRVYPDTCSIDTFEPTLAETEIANAQRYWTGVWEAGGVADQERAAWSGLVTAAGAGRAEWIITQYEPLNIDQKPAKAAPEDVILTIATEEPPASAEQAATAAFWRAFWQADGDKAQEQAARAALEAAVGTGRAAELVERYRPANLAARPTAPLTRDQVQVSAAFVVFPRTADLDVKQHSWSRPPQAVLLPDRFVFLGYNGSAPPVVVIGNPVPSPLVAGPDPSAPKEEQLQHDDAGEIVVPEDMRWMVDFDRAVETGMGFRVVLDDVQAANGFDRVLVVGLRLSADEMESKVELETLIAHHRFSRGGFSLVPQGTPTNNTESGGAGFTRGGDDPDASFDALKQGSLFTAQPGWLDKRDGQWLAEYLGIDGETLSRVRHADGKDQADARAMNAALWPATLGYWMETMMAPVFPPPAVEATRELFNGFVSGRGAIPAVRIGSQPYGILPATALSRLRWMEPRDGFGTTIHLPPADQGLGFVRALYPILRLMEADWRQMATAVSFAGKPGDPHQTLLDVVGLHPGSVEFSQRYAESARQMYNRLNLEGLGPFLSALILAALQRAGTDLLARLGYSGSAPPDLLGKFFFGRHHLLKGPLIDDRPLSESAAIRAYTNEGTNYLQWLIDAARTSIDAVYAQKGFKDDQPPQALLYLLLRHALQLGYHDVSVRLHESARLLDAEGVLLARRDEDFLHIREESRTSESRYQLLYKPERAITGDASTLVGDFIGKSLTKLAEARYLDEQVRALERLQDASTARLERAFAEHVDLCSYRLDAWLLGLVHFQLAAMRNLRDGVETAPVQGIYLGAYAWLEEVRPENRVLAPVRLEDPDLVEAFESNGEPPLLADSANQGYIHAPSLNQAVAAAVLRNGYLSNASPESRQTLAVNLTSERVRTALAMLEGVRGGQSLGALLGYQFERGLHDRHGLAEVDQFILDLRQAFPLRANRLASTSEDADIEALEARNVMDGLALVEQMRASGAATYPFGKPLPPLQTQQQADAINAEAQRLVEAHDAIADLALAEGVYQAVLGNYDRAASTYDAYSKGSFPPEPQIVQTPSSGTGLTHRVGLHLQAGIPPAALAGLTPRAQAEPAINAWLAGVLPPLGDVACKVSFLDAVSGEPAEHQVTLDALDLQPADLLHIVRDDDEPAMTELDDRIVRFTVSQFVPRPDVPVSIRYREKETAPLAVFEVLPLVRQLRRLTQASRPLKPSDLALANEATSAGDAALFIDPQRLLLVRAAMQSLRADLDDFLGDLEGPLADLENRRGEIIAGADIYVQRLVALLPRAAGFALPQSGWGFAYDFQRRVFRAVLEKCAAVAARWQANLEDFDRLLLEYEEMAEMPHHEMPTDEEKFGLLLRAERLISTQATAPLPASPDDLKTSLATVKRAAFDAKRVLIAGMQITSRTAVNDLLADANALLPVTAFDLAGLSFREEEDEAVRFAEDAASVVKAVLAEVDRRLAATQALTGPQDFTALEAAAKALLGDDFVIVPEFDLGAASGDELEKSLAASQSGSLFDHLENTLGVDFPVDTWLYGVARVRDKMRSWEQAVMLAGAFGRTEPELTALQLPFLPDDPWLALEFPPQARLDVDRLLYTAHFAAAFDKTRRQCGLLLDEWSEVIPANEATTGIAFHYDRPSCEAPQTLLLVTPTEFRGAWQWEDLVDALNETLDLAKLRAVEPVHVDQTTYARFLPATVMAVTVRQLTISANLALNNNLQAL